jgi:metal-sulfur cluster biosynthetic enzyme
MLVDHDFITDYVTSIELVTHRLESATDNERAQLLRELRELSLRLDAIFELHLAKEERVYLPLIDEHLDEPHQREVLEATHESYEEEKKMRDNCPLNVRDVAPRERHRLIFDTYTRLKPGEAFILINDHDPRPLYYQFEAEHRSVLLELSRTRAGGLAGSDRAEGLTPKLAQLRAISGLRIQRASMVNEEDILQTLRGVNDPEVGVNIVDLGLVYGAEIQGDSVRIVMTMTTPACPMHSYLTEEVREAILIQHEEIENISVELVWDPPWSPQMISERASVNSDRHEQRLRRGRDESGERNNSELSSEYLAFSQGSERRGGSGRGGNT